jgi:nucleotide-binding universal stress UspA family protein
MVDRSKAQRRLVVGIDGSDASAAALRWAVNHAASADRWVVAVYVCPSAVGSEVDTGGNASGRGGAALIAAARQELDRAVRRTVEPRSAADVASVVIPSPLVADALVDATRPGDLLVIGSRCSDQEEPIIGSTVRAVLRESSCPVILVPAMT